MKVIIILALAFVACSARPQETVWPTAYPKYDYKYDVNNPPTGDVKAAQESRDGDSTSGSYSVVEPDGTLRTVTYTVVGKSGFVAKVTRTPGYAVPDPQPNEPWRMRVVGSPL